MKVMEILAQVSSIAVLFSNRYSYVYNISSLASLSLYIHENELNIIIPPPPPPLSPGGEPLIGSEVEPGEGPVFLDYLSCDSNDRRLLDCPGLFFLPSCTNQNVIGVRCNGKSHHIQTKTATSFTHILFN